MKPSRIAAVVFTLLGSTAIAGLGWLAIPDADAAESAAQAAQAAPAAPAATTATVDYNPLEDPLVMAAIAAEMQDEYDPAGGIYHQLLDNLVVDGMSLKLAVDKQRYEANEARHAASRAKRKNARAGAWWSSDRPAPTHLNSPSPLWLLIPGGLMIFGGAYLRRRHQRRYGNTTPPSMARNQK